MQTQLAVAPRVSRVGRNPSHPFHVRHAPYEIQPFFIAPVLPGETMKNLSLQSRVLTQPLKASIIGWWIEHYVFYVKHRDLHDYTKFTDMVLDPAAVLTGHEDYQSATRDPFYGWATKAATTYTGLNWLKACTRVVVETFFRDEGEAWDVATIDGNPAAYLQQANAFQSAVLNTVLTDTSGAGQTDVLIPEQAADAGTLYSDVEKARWQYEFLRQQNLVNASYEDWLRSYGVRSLTAVQNKPELVRYMRDWTYPASHVIPSAVTPGDSSVTSACSWSIAERADKDRFFREPGFLVGYTCARPKVYLGNQNVYAAALMQDAYSWLPAILNGDATASWKKITDAAGDLIAGGATGDWWVDIKDLLIYGDQFTNQDVNAATTMNKMLLPAADVNVLHPVQASVDALFVSGDATAGVWQDGIVRLHVMGAQQDTSPRGAVPSAGPF